MMTDNELIETFRPIMVAGLIDGGFTGVEVVQSYQPTQQGVNTPPTVFFFKVSDHRYGFLGRKDTFDSGTQTMVHTEQQQYETRFQVAALAIQNPLNTGMYTASDLVNEVAAIMQSQITVKRLVGAGIGILRVTDVRNPIFRDDKDIFEASPSFDFTLTYLKERTSTSEIITKFGAKVYPV